MAHVVLAAGVGVLAVGVAARTMLTRERRREIHEGFHGSTSNKAIAFARLSSTVSACVALAAISLAVLATPAIFAMPFSAAFASVVTPTAIQHLTMSVALAALASTIELLRDQVAPAVLEGFLGCFEAIAISRRSS